MKISIITATYNSDKTLRETLESVINQTFENIEYIVIDGASSDGTLKLIKEYSSRIDRLISEPDSGIYDALNKGIKLASGDFVGFIHSDDAFTNNKVIEKVAELASDADAVYGNLNYVDAKNPEKIIRRWKSCEFSPSLIKKGWMPAHPTLYLRKGIYDNLGGFDLNFKIAADYESILRYFSTPGIRVKFLDEVLVNMKLGGASNRSLQSIFTKTNEDYRALIKNQIPRPMLTLARKNISKLSQFF